MIYAKQFAAALAGVCFMWGSAQANDERAQQRDAAPVLEAPAPEAVGATNDVVILELGPAQGGASAEDVNTMQLLLLQLLMMQPDGGASGEVFDVPRAPAGVGI